MGFHGFSSRGKINKSSPNSKSTIATATQSGFMKILLEKNIPEVI